MISKKLLSEVLSVDLSNKNNMLDPVPAGTERGSDVIFYWLQNEDRFYNGNSISIYQLANMCKEWAFKQKFPYCITSRIIDDYKGKWEAETGYGFGVPASVDFIADSEPAAIFLACEWIMKQKELK